MTALSQTHLVVAAEPADGVGLLIEETLFVSMAGNSGHKVWYQPPEALPLGTRSA